MSVRQKVSRRNIQLSIRRSVLTAKCPHGRVCSRSHVLTTKSPYGEVSVRRSVRTANCFTAKCPTAKSPTAKSPGTFKSTDPNIYWSQKFLKVLPTRRISPDNSHRDFSTTLPPRKNPSPWEFPLWVIFAFRKIMTSYMHVIEYSCWCELKHKTHVIKPSFFALLSVLGSNPIHRRLAHPGLDLYESGK